MYKGRKSAGWKLQIVNVKGHAMWKTLIAAVTIVVLCPLAVGFGAEQPSFEAKTYEHGELGFSVHYPADFVEGEMPSGDLPDIGLPESEVLFLANSPQLLPNVAILVHPGSVSLESVGDIEAVYAALSGGEVKTESARETTLKDGATEALEIVVAYTVQGFPVKSLSLFAARGSQTVQVQVTWTDPMGDRASQKVDEIAYSLRFE